MIYNNTNCQVLNFLDMTSYYSLERSKEKYRLMKLLNTTVHHEMIAPLKAQEDISRCLYENLKSSENQRMAKILNVSSKMLLLHTQDLLDWRIIENGSFIPHYTHESVHKVIQEITHMMNFTLRSQNLEIRHICRSKGQMLYLDKRRIQQVLLNLLNNAIKFQESGVINVFSDIKFDKGQLMIQITVRDNGKGMSQEEVEKVFEPFSMVGNRQS